MQKTNAEKYQARRRAFLVRALASGLLASGGLLSPFRGARAQVLGRVPKPLAQGQSIYDVTGPVMVNGKLITREAGIGPNDTVETGKGARAIFVVGSDAFLLRDNSKMEMKGNDAFVNQLRVLTGALLSVFGRGPRFVTGPTSTIGIRGTGLYVEVESERTYVCTCYGETDISTIDDPAITERIVSLHHDAPRYVLARPEKGKRIISAPFKNHDDLELMLLESLVGRAPPFSLFDEDYGGARRY